MRTPQQNAVSIASFRWGVGLAVLGLLVAVVPAGIVDSGRDAYAAEPYAIAGIVVLLIGALVLHRAAKLEGGRA